MAEAKLEALIHLYDDTVRLREKLLGYNFFHEVLSTFPVCMRSQEILDERIKEKTSECEKLRHWLKISQDKVAKLYSQYDDITEYYQVFVENNYAKEFLDFAIFLRNRGESCDTKNVTLTSETNHWLQRFENLLKNHFSKQISFDHNKQKQELETLRVDFRGASGKTEDLKTQLNAANENISMLNSNLKTALESLYAEKSRHEAIKKERDNLDYLSEKLCSLLLKCQLRVCSVDETKNTNTKAPRKHHANQTRNKKNITLPDQSTPRKSSVNETRNTNTKDVTLPDQSKIDGNDVIEIDSDTESEDEVMVSLPSTSQHDHLFEKNPKPKRSSSKRKELKTSAIDDGILNKTTATNDETLSETIPTSYKTCRKTIINHKRTPSKIIPTDDETPNSFAQSELPNIQSSHSPSDPLESSISIPLDLSESEFESEFGYDSEIGFNFSDFIEEHHDSDSSIDEVDWSNEDNETVKMPDNPIQIPTSNVPAIHLAPNGVLASSMNLSDRIQRIFSDSRIRKPISSTDDSSKITTSQLFRCEKCAKYFTANNSDGKAVKCPICDVSVSTFFKTYISGSIINVTPEINESQQSTSVNKVRKKSTYVRNFQKVKCNICKKILKHKYSLKRHLRIVHYGEKPYKCSICGKGFSDNRGLTVHGFVHGSKNLFSCCICHKGFRDPTVKHNHEKRVHGEPRFECNHCGMRFYLKQKLVYHINTKHFNGILQQFKCSICPKYFATKSNLKTHYMVHDTQRPYKCSICNRYFKYKNCRRFHEWKKHGKGDRFPCKFCKKAYSVEKNLIDHVHKRHSAR